MQAINPGALSYNVLQLKRGDAALRKVAFVSSCPSLRLIRVQTEAKGSAPQRGAGAPSPRSRAGGQPRPQPLQLTLQSAARLSARRWAGLASCLGYDAGVSDIPGVPGLRKPGVKRPRGQRPSCPSAPEPRKPGQRPSQTLPPPPPPRRPPEPEGARRTAGPSPAAQEDRE